MSSEACCRKCLGVVSEECRRRSVGGVSAVCRQSIGGGDGRVRGGVGGRAGTACGDCLGAHAALCCNKVGLAREGVAGGAFAPRAPEKVRPCDRALVVPVLRAASPADLEAVAAPHQHAALARVQRPEVCIGVVGKVGSEHDATPDAERRRFLERAFVVEPHVALCPGLDLHQPGVLPTHHHADHAGGHGPVACLVGALEVLEVLARQHHPVPLPERCAAVRRVQRHLDRCGVVPPCCTARRQHLVRLVVRPVVQDDRPNIPGLQWPLRSVSVHLVIAGQLHLGPDAESLRGRLGCLARLPVCSDVELGGYTREDGDLASVEEREP
mmetsp:Transcript_37781/g.77600  ORF Transcript_37781/g.77600 Transcript_37781/m.77600 type:complete len:326 (-) Transcript_37781:989-1966(-)